MNKHTETASALASIARTVAGAKRDKKLLVFGNMVREAAALVHRGGADLQLVADAMIEVACANGLIKQPGPDAIQKILSDAFTPVADRRDDFNGLDPPARPNGKAESEPEPERTLRLIRVAAWQDKPVPPREWTVFERVPHKNVTLLSGDGGTGKTVLALHMAAAVALGRDWLGAVATVGPSLVLCAEDDEDELHRRFVSIAAHYEVPLSDLRDITTEPLAGEDALLAVPNRSGLIEPTKLFERFKQAALALKPKLIVVDNSADVFGGNENDRAQVRRFISILRGLAIDADAAVLLTSHPSLSGMASGSGLSGSTAWNASVRSRMYLRRAVTEKDEEPDPDLRLLEMMKSNYARAGEIVNVRWQNGLFVPIPGIGGLDKLAAEQAADALFLKLLDKFTAQNRNVSHHKSSNTYAPGMFAKDPEAKAPGTRKALVAAMDRLFHANKITVEPYGRPSHPHTRLARKRYADEDTP